MQTNETMKKLSVIAAAILMSCAACTKPTDDLGRVPSGNYRMYNDQMNTSIKLASPGFMEIDKADTFFASASYSGSLIGSTFIMPAGVWGNKQAVTGTWRYYGAFLEFYYMGANNDSSAAAYVPVETYYMDFIR